ncbi:hypothetical protein DPEC_G00183960 [Dallia pectoralis]|uniref:Uncharacterized protein n=1 Tax=Dallia pectoralis TaxID=75939 RepID=A0ACC2GBC6_DALPE|nr:hypothetical protein DPEC_G00183960 [Dallia pectoralis]
MLVGGRKQTACWLAVHRGGCHTSLSAREVGSAGEVERRLKTESLTQVSSQVHIPRLRREAFDGGDRVPLVDATRQL